VAWAIEASQQFGFADGGSGHVCTFSAGAPAVDDFDVLCVNSDTTVSAPSGFSAAESAVTNQGSYVFTRKAVGGEAAAVTVTTNGSHNCQVLWVRISGGNAVDLAESAQANGASGTSTPAFTSSALAETGELALAFAALHSWTVAPPTSPSWSSGYTNIVSGSQGAGGGSSVAGFVGYKEPAGTGAESPSVSWTNAADDRYLLFVTLTAAAADGLTGELVATLPALTAAATGTASAVAAVVATLPALAATAAGTAAAAAALTATFPALTAAAAGTSSAEAVLAAALPALTVALSDGVTRPATSTTAVTAGRTSTPTVTASRTSTATVG
jgi:hypothetical protein